MPNQNEYNCGDCRYYLPIDAFKGSCKLTKIRITPESIKCENLEKNKKCKFCLNFSFSENQQFVGKCMKQFDAYPDMTAVTCEIFKWK